MVDCEKDVQAERGWPKYLYADCGESTMLNFCHYIEWEDVDRVERVDYRRFHHHFTWTSTHMTLIFDLAIPSNSGSQQEIDQKELQLFPCISILYLKTRTQEVDTWNTSNCFKTKLKEISWCFRSTIAHYRKYHQNKISCFAIQLYNWIQGNYCI